MKKVLIILMYILTLSPIANGEDERVLVVEKREVDSETVYDLVLIGTGRREKKTIWTKSVPRSQNGNSSSWAGLVDFSQNKEGILVLLEISPWSLTLLQFDPQGKLTASLKNADPGWHDHISKGGLLTLEAPNEVTMRLDNGVTERVYLTPEGDLIDDNGALYARTSTHRLFDPSDVVKGANEMVQDSSEPTTNSGQSGKRIPIPKQSAPFTLPVLWKIGIGFVVAIGLLCYLIKRRN